jgi:hypothetical protein
MKTSLFKETVISLALALSAVPAFAKTHNPQALVDILERSEQLAEQGKQAVVMFDLDDTLINTKDRNLRILKDFARQPELAASHPSDVQKILALRIDQVKYLLADTMKEIGVTDADLIKQASEFWLAHFFSNEYCAKDKANPGAARYLHLLARTGAKIVYLTGRDIPRMADGTRQNLLRNRFPMNPGQAELIMKPDPKMDDLQFKISQYQSVEVMGEVVGVFENEPANINSMADAFPAAAAVFLDTIHSPKPDVPEDRVEWVGDFRF